MKYPCDLEMIATLTFEREADYLVAIWPSGLGEYRIFGNVVGLYEYREDQVELVGTMALS